MGFAEKHIAQRIHAKRRAAERFNLTLNRHQLRDLVTLIQQGKAELVERQSLRVTLWALEWKGQKMKVVYDSSRKTIVSFLPLKAKDLKVLDSTTRTE